MADTVLLTAYSNIIPDVLELAHEYGLGLELMQFAMPDTLDGDWQREVERYRHLLRGLRGPLTLHGPFIDTVSGSPDARINAIAMDRYRHAIDIAAELDAEIVVFHANFIGSLRNSTYREGWLRRNIDFWAEMAEYATECGRVITLENMWEYDPAILSDLLQAVDHPALMACLDVGHAHLFGDDEYSLADWITALKPWLVHTHMNNNDGRVDEHHGFDWVGGVLDYRRILPQFRALTPPPKIVLEMWDVNEIRASLPFLELNHTAPEIATGEHPEV